MLVETVCREAELVMQLQYFIPNAALKTVNLFVGRLNQAFLLIESQRICPLNHNPTPGECEYGSTQILSGFRSKLLRWWMISCELLEASIFASR